MEEEQQRCLPQSVQQLPGLLQASRVALQALYLLPTLSPRHPSRALPPLPAQLTCSLSSAAARPSSSSSVPAPAPSPQDTASSALFPSELCPIRFIFLFLGSHVDS